MAGVTERIEPGNLWFIRHCCFQGNDNFSKTVDRRRWLYWLFQARRRYGLSVLNYTVMHQEVQILVMDQGRGEIPCSMQLIGTRLAAEFNKRCNAQSLFWERRYHATSVDSTLPMQRCFTDMDLDAVRHGLTSHPEFWGECGYHEVMYPPARARCIDFSALQRLLNPLDMEKLQKQRRSWVREALSEQQQSRFCDSMPGLRYLKPSFEGRIDLSESKMQPAPLPSSLKLVPKGINT